MGVILRCELATHNESMSKLPFVSLLPIFSAIFLPFELVYNWKSYHRNKRVNFLLRHSVITITLNFVRFIASKFNKINFGS